MKTMYLRTSVISSLFILAGCGGGSAITNAPINNPSLPTAEQIATYSDGQIVELGTNISQLSNAALEVLSTATSSNNPVGQIESLTAAQIAALSPEQVQLIGTNGANSASGVAAIRYLSNSAWAQLVSNSNQVGAIAPAVIATLSGSEVAQFGNNFNQLSDAALAALTNATFLPNNPVGQIQSITPSEIATLSLHQVRILGAAELGGTIGTSKINWLNSATWSVLVSNSAQVAAITAEEIPTLAADEIIALGTNINQLSDIALAALTFATNASSDPIGQVESITAAQIAALSPRQVQLIGTASSSGIKSAPSINWLNFGTWQKLVSDPTQVAAFTSNVIPTLTAEEIIALGGNLNQLSDAALSSLTYLTNPISNPVGQIESISSQQISGLNPSQISIIASIERGTAIAYLNISAFGSLTANQVSVLTPINMMDVTASELASLSPAALSGMAPATIMSLTIGQKSLLSVAQHSACGC